MDTDISNKNEIIIGNCTICNEKNILTSYCGEAYCCDCIKKDDYLRTILRF